MNDDSYKEALVRNEPWALSYEYGHPGALIREHKRAEFWKREAEAEEKKHQETTGKLKEVSTEVGRLKQENTRLKSGLACDKCEFLIEAQRERNEHYTDLCESKELLQRSLDLIQHTAGMADEISGFLDMVRCSECGKQISHVGFLSDDGLCLACSRKKEK